MSSRFVIYDLKSEISFLFFIAFCHIQKDEFYQRKKDPVILAKIQTLYLEHKSASVIAKAVGMTKRQILWRIEKLKKFGTMVQRPISGRPRKTTPKEDFLIVHQALQDPFTSAEMIRTSLPDLNVSKSTILRRLCESGKMGSFWAVKKPFLTKEHRHKRVEWAEKYKKWTPEQWNHVLWSDECTFRQWSSRRYRVWRPLHSGYQRKFIQPSIAHPAKINLWGCFCGHGLGALAPIEGNLNAKKYIAILDKNLRPSVNKLYDHEDWIFMQDNSPNHNAHQTGEYLEKKGVTCMNWPANSPDLNPIENVWGEIKRKLRFLRPSSSEELQECVEKIWNNLDQQYLVNLIESMPKRVALVIKKNGDSTKY